MQRRSWVLAAVWVLVGMAFGAAAQQGKLKDGDFVAIIGDSITEQKDYSVVMENYLLMCQPASKLRAMQWGWSGETAPAFRGRINDVVKFAPTVATTCYGMNDGGYSPMTPEKASRYRDAQTAIVKRFKEAGVKLIVVGSPGCVDTYTFDVNKGKGSAEMYNPVLAELGKISKEVAEKEGVAFADVYGAMFSAMNKAKAKYGEKYYLAGADGFHPGRNGHLVMAYAFLKALGCDGNIGTITLDLQGGKAEASEGHRVVSASSSSVEIESTRYPYCFFGDPASPDATRGVIEFVPFNEELNRFTLVVKNAPAGKVRVTWGSVSKEFEAERLAQGINLAAEFLDNPFGPAFLKVEQAVRAQQNFETPLTKQLMRGMAMAEGMVPEEKEAVARIIAGAAKKDEALFARAREAVTPVRHVIKVEAAR